MTYMTTMTGLPNPDANPEFYAGVPAKRLVAWIVDAALIFGVSLLISLLTFGLGFFVFFGIVTVISFLYRWITITGRSATWGMRFAAIELRNRYGERFDAGTAALHTLGYLVSVSITPLQLISIILMLVSSRKQGLTDHLLGTAAINATARL